MHRRTVSEVLQPTMDAVPGDRSAENKAYQQNPEIAHVEHIQDLSRRRSQHLAHGDLLPLVFALEHDKAEHAHNRDEDSDKTEQSDQRTDLQFLFVGMLQNFIIKADHERILRIELLKRLAHMFHPGAEIASGLKLHIGGIIIVVFLPPLVFAP